MGFCLPVAEAGWPRRYHVRCDMLSASQGCVRALDFERGTAPLAARFAAAFAFRLTFWRVLRFAGLSPMAPMLVRHQASRCSMVIPSDAPTLSIFGNGAMSRSTSRPLRASVRLASSIRASRSSTARNGARWRK